MSLMTVLLVSGLAAAQTRQFCATALGRSAHSFCRYFQELKKEPLNPVERVVFSLVLTKAQAQKDCKPPLHG